MKTAKFSADGKDYEMFYDCPDQEINNQINEIFSDKDYELAKRGKDLVVLDVGANVGMFSLFIKDYARKIYAVEPSRRVFACLKENTKDWDNIEIFNVGLMNRKGKEFLYGKEEETPQTMMIKGDQKELIDIITIEEFMNENKIDHIDVMKIDTEGAEYVILADNSFKAVAEKIDFIIGETHYIDTMIPEHVLLMLKRAGFKPKLLRRKNCLVVLNYHNPYTNQVDNYPVKKPTMFTAIHI